MADGIQDAADAFARDMGGSAPSGGGINERSPTPELIFGNSDDHEDDLVAGGDNVETDEEIAARKAEEKRARQPEKDDDDDGGFDPFAVLDDDEDDEDDDPDKRDDDDNEDDEEMSRIFKVMVDGEEEEMTLREALEGGIRTKTFHKRMNDIDNIRNEVTAFAHKVVEDRQQVDNMLAEAEEILSGLLPEEPDWDKLFAEDPKSARELQKQYDNYRGKITDIRKKREDRQKEENEKRIKEDAEFAKSEFPKFAAKAKWRNQKHMQKDLKSMRKTALAIGFNDEEIGNVLDHRMLEVLLKASKYDRMMAARPRAVRKGKTPVNPGAGSGSTARRGIAGAQKRLAQTGSIDDATSVFAEIINPKRRR